MICLSCERDLDDAEFVITPRRNWTRRCNDCYNGVRCWNCGVNKAEHAYSSGGRIVKQVKRMYCDMCISAIRKCSAGNHIAGSTSAETYYQFAEHGT